MAKISGASKKSRGRPATHGEPLTVRVSPEVLEALDAARAAMKIEPSRPDVLRFALTKWLRDEGYLK